MLSLQLFLLFIAYYIIPSYASFSNNIAYLSPSNKHKWEVKILQKRAVQENAKVSFTHGVASGDPYSHSIILWTRAVSNGVSCVNYQVSQNKEFKGKLKASGKAYSTKDVDYTVKVEAKGLDPFTKYYYRFQSCDGSSTSIVGTTKTAPKSKQNIDSLSLAVYSCSNFPFGYFNAYGGPVRRDSVDYVLHLGDYTYEYKNGEYGNGTSINRIPYPNKETVLLEDYRTRYATYRTDKDLQASHATFAWIPVWDDHEVADNTWKAGSADSNDDYWTVAKFGVDFTTRKANAIRAYFEWMPIRQVDLDDKYRIWRNFKMGQLADIIMLDTRQYNRDLTDVYYNTDYVAYAANEEPRSMMGYLQESWFYKTLTASKQRGAIWRIIGQQVVISQINYTSVEPDFKFNRDAWDGYQANRNRILDHLRTNDIDNNIVLAGDSHANWVSDFTYANKTGYDTKSGNGAYGVEFGGTAVSSPSPFGRTLPVNASRVVSQFLVEDNAELKWSEGFYRGYYELKLTSKNAKATYYALRDLLSRNSNEFVSAEFTVQAGANRLQRPVAGGKIQAGYLGNY